MPYPICQIPSLTDWNICPICKIDSYNWGGDYRVPAFGQFGIYKGHTLAVHMWAEEAHPAVSYENSQDPVYKDSALEFFLQWKGEEGYFNFEINSNAALRAQYGPDRTSRTFLPSQWMDQITCTSKKEDNCWHVYLLLPLDALLAYCSLSERPDTLYFNFYKLKESEPLMHFASYTKIDSQEPNFHLPEFFASASF